MAQQSELFEKPTRDYTWLAHEPDIGGGPDIHDGGLIHGSSFTCKRCGWESEYFLYRTKAEIITDASKGIPCENCNNKPSTIGE